MIRKKIQWLVVIIFLAFSCKDKYVAKVNTPPIGFLVVEGIINGGSGPTTITLSRTSGLDSIYTIYESGAQISVQAQNGGAYPLTEQTKGIYSVSAIPIDQTQQYRLYIKTSNGEEYTSAYVPVKISPPIDSVGFNAGTDQVVVSVTTHDDQRNSVYYQWKYEETWLYFSKFGSPLIWQDDEFVARPDSLALPSNCWQTDTSTSIIIASTANLNADLVYQFPVAFVPYATSNKLYSRYSILVKQYVLGKDAYEWKQKIQKNTEQLGSIFDAQPSETGGNIQCLTNPVETVIGFIYCSTETEKRIFIDRSELANVTVYWGYDTCEELTHCIECGNSPAEGPFLWDAIARDGVYAITGAGPPDSMYIAPVECIDCRLKGGVAIKPGFWQ